METEFSVQAYDERGVVLDEMSPTKKVVSCSSQPDNSAIIKKDVVQTDISERFSD